MLCPGAATSLATRIFTVILECGCFQWKWAWFFRAAAWCRLGLCGHWLCGNSQTEHRDGRLVPYIRLNSSHRCCQRLLAAGLTLILWDLHQLLDCMAFSCWHMNRSFVSKVLLKFEKQEDVTADSHTEWGRLTCEMMCLAERWVRQRLSSCECPGDRMRCFVQT